MATLLRACLVSVAATMLVSAPASASVLVSASSSAAEDATVAEDASPIEGAMDGFFRSIGDYLFGQDEDDYHSSNTTSTTVAENEVTNNGNTTSSLATLGPDHADHNETTSEDDYGDSATVADNQVISRSSPVAQDRVDQNGTTVGGDVELGDDVSGSANPTMVESDRESCKNETVEDDPAGLAMVILRSGRTNAFVTYYQQPGDNAFSTLTLPFLSLTNNSSEMNETADQILDCRLSVNGRSTVVKKNLFCKRINMYLFFFLFFAREKNYETPELDGYFDRYPARQVGLEDMINLVQVRSLLYVQCSYVLRFLCDTRCATTSQSPARRGGEERQGEGRAKRWPTSLEYSRSSNLLFQVSLLALLRETRVRFPCFFLVFFYV